MRGFRAATRSRRRRRRRFLIKPVRVLFIFLFFFYFYHSCERLFISAGIGNYGSQRQTGVSRSAAETGKLLARLFAIKKASNAIELFAGGSGIFSSWQRTPALFFFFFLSLGSPWFIDLARNHFLNALHANRRFRFMNPVYIPRSINMHAHRCAINNGRYHAKWFNLHFVCKLSFFFFFLSHRGKKVPLRWKQFTKFASSNRKESTSSLSVKTTRFTFLNRHYKVDLLRNKCLISKLRRTFLTISNVRCW